MHQSILPNGRVSMLHINKQFHPQYTPQPGDLGYNPKGSTNTHEILDKQKSTNETNPFEQGITLIASPKPTSPIRVEELKLNALINPNFNMPIPVEKGTGPEREHVEVELRRDRHRFSEIFERTFNIMAPPNTIGKRASNTRPPSPSHSPSKPKHTIVGVGRSTASAHTKLVERSVSMS